MDHEIHRLEPLIGAFAQAVKETTGSTLSEIRTNPEGGSSEPDAIGLLETPDGTWPLVFAIKKDVYPRDVRDAMWDLQGQQNRMKNPSDVVLIMLADHLSKGAREELKSRGMSFFESNGTLFFKHRNWLINIEKAKSSTKGALRELDVFKGSREMVVHALLHMERDWFHGREVVEMSKTSGYTVSTVLKELEKFGWVESQGEGPHRMRRLVKPTELLDAWAKVWVQRKQATTRWYFFCQNPKRLVEELASNMDMDRYRDSSTCAFTGAVAANRLSPLLTHVDVAELIVPSNTLELASRIGLKPTEKGANVVLIERAGASELFQQYSPEERAWFASPFIQYLDLLNGRGRNAELAAQLRSDILRM